MSAGSEFYTVGAATRKLRAPKLSLCDNTHNKLDWNVNCDQVHSYEVMLRALKANNASLNCTVLNR